MMEWPTKNEYQENNRGLKSIIPDVKQYPPALFFKTFFP